MTIEEKRAEVARLQKEITAEENEKSRFDIDHELPQVKCFPELMQTYSMHELFSELLGTAKSYGKKVEIEPHQGRGVTHECYELEIGHKAKVLMTFVFHLGSDPNKVYMEWRDRNSFTN